MLILTIVLMAVLAFLIVIAFIYKDEIFKVFKKKDKSKKAEPKQEKKSEPKNEDFIPLKTQYDEYERDESLNALFAEDDTVFEDETNKGEDFSMGTNQNDVEPVFPDDNLESLLSGNYSRKRKSKSNKPIASQIKDLSPELKALLIDTALKKRDDV